MHLAQANVLKHISMCGVITPGCETRLTSSALISVDIPVSGLYLYKIQKVVFSTFLPYYFCLAQIVTIFVTEHTVLTGSTLHFLCTELVTLIILTSFEVDASNSHNPHVL